MPIHSNQSPTTVNARRNRLLQKTESTTVDYSIILHYIYILIYTCVHYLKKIYIIYIYINIQIVASCVQHFPKRTGPTESDPSVFSPGNQVRPVATGATDGSRRLRCPKRHGRRAAEAPWEGRERGVGGVEVLKF